MDHFHVLGIVNLDSPLMKSVGSLTNGWIGHHSWGADLSDWSGASNFFSASTTLLPTLAYLFLLAAVSLLAIPVAVVQAFVLRVLRLDVETEKSIFFYVGSALGFLVILGKATIEFSRLVWGSAV